MFNSSNFQLSFKLVFIFVFFYYFLYAFRETLPREFHNSYFLKNVHSLIIVDDLWVMTFDNAKCIHKNHKPADSKFIEPPGSRSACLFLLGWNRSYSQVYTFLPHHHFSLLYYFFILFLFLLRGVHVNLHKYI